MIAMDAQSVFVVGILIGVVLGCLVTLWMQGRSEYNKLHKEFLEEKARIKKEIAEGKARMRK